LEERFVGCNEQFDGQLYGMVAPACRAGYPLYSTYRRNPPESGLLFQVTVIRVRNQRVCGSGILPGLAHDTFCCKYAALAAKWPPSPSEETRIPAGPSIREDHALASEMEKAREDTMAKGILIAAMDFSDVAEDEFHDWYDTEHIPERLRVPGFLNAERWIGSQKPKVSVALYDLDDVGVLHSPAYQAVGGNNGTPWTKRVTSRTQMIIRLEGEQLRPGDALAPTGTNALLLIAMNVAPEQEGEFNEWYNTEHLPQLGAVPGVLMARRYRGSGATQRYAAIYHFANADVPNSAAWKSAANTPWTERMRPHFRDLLRIDARRYTRR
jgi:hypothetical protein